MFKVRHDGFSLTNLLGNSISLSAALNTSHIIKQKQIISSLSGDFSGSECNTKANNRKLWSDWVLPMKGKHVIIHVQNLEAAKKEKMRKKRLSKKETACDEQRRGPHDFTVPIYLRTLH